MFEISAEPIVPERYRDRVTDVSCGGYATFEGWVRDHNEGHQVTRLDYEVHAPLAITEGEKILAEAREKFGITKAFGIHREGSLGLGDCAVFVAVSSPHRGEAFAACRYIIDEVKQRLPIWKKEFYVNGDSGWVNCERCANPHEHRHGEPVATD